MVCTVKRFSAGCLAVWFAVWSVLFPTLANAAIYNAASTLTGRTWYVPAVGTGIAGSRILAAGATMLGRASPWISAITIGLPIMQHIIELRNGTAPVTPDGLPLPPEFSITPNPELLPTPPGWRGPNLPPETAHPTSGAGVGVAPTTRTAPASITWFNQVQVPQVLHPSAEAACSAARPGYILHSVEPVQNIAWCNFMYGATMLEHNTYVMQSQTYMCGPGETLSGNQCIGKACPDGSPILNNGLCYAAPECPTGYMMNYDSCILSENAPYKVKWPDGTNDNIPIFVPDPDNPGRFEPFDRNAPAATPDTQTAQKIADAINNVLKEFSKDEFGNPSLLDIKSFPQGGYEFQQQVQTINNNQTYTTTNIYVTNPSGEVVSVYTTTNNGPITNISTAPAVQMPTDYNREATQQKILTGEGAQDAPDWASSVKQQKDSGTKAITDLLEPIKDQFSTDKNKWFSWVWTPPVGNCSPISGNVHGNFVSWNICPYVGMVRDAMGWLFSVVGAWVIYNQMFRREE